MKHPEPTSTVTHENCMNLMGRYADGFFDLAVVDPPYGINMDGGNVGYKGFNNFEKKNWDAATPGPEYFAELRRVSKNQIIFGGNYFVLPPSRCWLIWDKGAGFKGRTYAEAELAWTSFDANVKIFKHDPLAGGDYKNKIHPTQKPIKLYNWIFHHYTTPGQTVLDTHLGAGGSRIAADAAGLNFVGCELDADYYLAQNKRFQNYKNQLTLF